MDVKTRRRLRQIAHHLRPVIIIGDGGVSDGVVAETNRALVDHELIKVKINVEDRDQRAQLGASLAEACAAQSVQKIGKIVVLYRENSEADPHLSNVSRANVSRAGVTQAGR